MIFVEVLRFLVVVLGLVIGLSIGQHFGDTTISRFFGASIGILVAYVLGGVIGRAFSKSVNSVTRQLRDIPGPEILAGAILGMAGLVATSAVAVPVLLLLPNQRIYFAPGFAAIAWVLGYLGVKLGFNKAAQLTESVGLSNRFRSVKPDISASAVVLDTSAALERITWVLGSFNLLPNEIIIPRIVLDEVRVLQNSPDIVTRRRATRALEFLDLMNKNGYVTRVAEETVPESDQLEEKVLILANRLRARVLTTSANQVEMAKKSNVGYIDLREVAADIVPDYLPGELFKIELVKVGHQPSQAVGYMPDGDMVVVNDASHMVGKGEVEVEVLSTRRTSQGVLIFGKLKT